MLSEQRGKPGYEGYLNEHVVPVAQVLKDARLPQRDGRQVSHSRREGEVRPGLRGFERSYAMVMGGASHWGDQSGIVAMDPDKPPKAIYRGEQQGHRHPPRRLLLVQAFTDSCSTTSRVARIRQALLRLPGLHPPHWPLHAPEADIAKYEGRYKEGYDKLRKGTPRAHEAPRHRARRHSGV